MKFARWLILLLAVLPAAAQDSETAAEELRTARVAMEAKMRLGDLLREKGDLDGARTAYREALAVYEKALARVKRRPAARPPRVEIPEEVIEEDEIADEEIQEEPMRADPFKRRAGRRAAASGRTQNAVLAGLKWLAAHQDTDGKWDTDGFMKHDPAGDKTDGAGGALHNVGVTSLSLLAFLGAGHTDRGSTAENAYGQTVRRGLRFLLTNQDQEGCFTTRSSHHFIYDHAMATLAMAEAYALTKNPRYKGAAQKGVDFIQRARNPYLAWRYGVRSGENDTSVTAWCVMALKSAQLAGLQVDEGAWEGALAWVDKMTDPEFGQVGYITRGGAVARIQGMQDKFPPEKSQAMTAAGLMIRIFCGQDPRRSDVMKKGAALCLQTPPQWDRDAGTIDMYYWFYGTLAMFQVGGEPWRKWNAAMKAAIVESQHPQGAGARTGSWDPVGAWGTEGGRVYSTAMMTLCLEVYYRYDRVFGKRGR